jgi:CBS domain-containing protein
MAIQQYRGSYLLPPLSEIEVAEVMHAGIMSARPDMPVRTLARTMSTYRIHAVVVAGIASHGEGHERLVWRVLSDMDLVRAVATGRADASAGELATADAVTIEPTARLETAAKLMDERGAAHLVVVDQDEPVGVISSFDVANALAWAGR